MKYVLLILFLVIAGGSASWYNSVRTKENLTAISTKDQYRTELDEIDHQITGHYDEITRMEEELSLKRNEFDKVVLSFRQDAKSRINRERVKKFSANRKEDAAQRKKEAAEQKREISEQRRTASERGKEIGLSALSWRKERQACLDRLAEETAKQNNLEIQIRSKIKENNRRLTQAELDYSNRNSALRLERSSRRTAYNGYYSQTVSSSKGVRIDRELAENQKNIDELRQKVAQANAQLDKKLQSSKEDWEQLKKQIKEDIRNIDEEAEKNRLDLVYGDTPVSSEPSKEEQALIIDDEEELSNEDIAGLSDLSLTEHLLKKSDKFRGFHKNFKEQEKDLLSRLDEKRNELKEFNKQKTQLNKDYVNFTREFEMSGHKQSFNIAVWGSLLSVIIAALTGGAFISSREN